MFQMTLSCSVDVFVGSFPPLKFDVNHDSVVQFGIGALIASKDIVKIVGRIDTSAATSVLKICAAMNYNPANFFDIRCYFNSTLLRYFDKTIYHYYFIMIIVTEF